jgi:DNA-binding HxlR family transcriptional regulator
VLGERWTLLIVRDAFFGVRRFGDFVAHLDIPRAVLTARLKALVKEGVLKRIPGESGRDEYGLTDKGTKLWPVVRDLMAWGDEFYSSAGPLRILRHDTDGGVLDRQGRCASCGELIEVAEITMEPGPGFGQAGWREDVVSRVIAQPRRLLEPVHG